MAHVDDDSKLRLLGADDAPARVPRQSRFSIFALLESSKKRLANVEDTVVEALEEEAAEEESTTDNAIAGAAEGNDGAGKPAAARQRHPSVFVLLKQATARLGASADRNDDDDSAAAPEPLAEKTSAAVPATEDDALELEIKNVVFHEERRDAAAATPLRGTLRLSRDTLSFGCEGRDYSWDLGSVGVETFAGGMAILGKEEESYTFTDVDRPAQDSIKSAITLAQAPAIPQRTCCGCCRRPGAGGGQRVAPASDEVTEPLVAGHL